MKIDGAFHDEITKAIERFPGASVSFDMRKNHPFAQVEFGGKTRKVFIAATTSDHRAAKNAGRDVRKACRELGAVEK